MKVFSRIRLQSRQHEGVDLRAINCECEFSVIDFCNTGLLRLSTQCFVNRATTSNEPALHNDNYVDATRIRDYIIKVNPLALADQQATADLSSRNGVPVMHFEPTGFD